MPSSSDYRNTTSTLSAPAPQQPASALPAEGFQFARPYAHTPAWAHSAVTAAFIATVEESADASAPSPDSTAPSPDIAAPSPDTTVSSADTAQQPQQATDQRAETESAPSSINDLLSTSGRTSTADLFRQPLKPQDYRASSAFVQKVVSQLLETVDRRRPFGHLRSFVTPDIMDIVEQFSSHRSRAIMELAGPSLTTPGAPALQPAPYASCDSICALGVSMPKNLRQLAPWSGHSPRGIRQHYAPVNSPSPPMPSPQMPIFGWKSAAPTAMGPG